MCSASHVCLHAHASAAGLYATAPAKTSSGDDWGDFSSGGGAAGGGGSGSGDWVKF